MGTILSDYHAVVNLVLFETVYRTKRKKLMSICCHFTPIDKFDVE